VEVPLTCPDVPDTFLDPRATWPDPDAYDAAAHRLADMFAENFTGYADGVGEEIRAAGPIVRG
jgi:phosphoenolpyruvate carboxykinase (ATP)